MFGALLAEADGDFCLVASALDLNDNTLTKDCMHHVITGLEVIAIQALEQFVLYTGVRPTAEQFQAAVAFARS